MSCSPFHESDCFIHTDSDQAHDPADRRRKQLTLSGKGKSLEHELTSTQMERFARAYRDAGAEAVEGFRRVLIGIVEPEDRARVRPTTMRNDKRR